MALVPIRAEEGELVCLLSTVLGLPAPLGPCPSPGRAAQCSYHTGDRGSEWRRGSPRVTACSKQPSLILNPDSSEPWLRPGYRGGAAECGSSVLSLPLLGCVTLCQSLTLSEPQIPLEQRAMMIDPSYKKQKTKKHVQCSDFSGCEAGAP